jgi:hypothetical protein
MATDITTNDLTATGNLTITGDYTSTDGNITLTNGDITLTTGTLFGNVVGTITEEIIDAQIINLREGTPSSGAFIGMEITDTATKYGEISMRDISNNYNFRVYSGGNVDIAGAIVWNGATFNNVNGGDILMNDGVIKSDNTSTSRMALDFDNGTLQIKDGITTNNVMNISDEFITIKNPSYPTITGTQISDTFYRLNDSSNNNGNPRVIIESVDGISLLTGTALTNLLISPLGDISYETGTGDLYGYNGNSATYSNNSTRMEHFRLDETNYKNHEYEIGVSIPLQTYLERTITTTSTAWFDLNNQLSVRLISNAETNSFFVVDFSFYAVITSGARLWFKLIDSSIADLDNFYQPTYLNNTMSQFVLDTNGATDIAGVHNVRFYVRNYPANTTKTIRVACWVITTSGHKVIFKSGPLIVALTNPSTSFNKYPPQFLQAHKLLNSTNISTASPTGWSAPDEEDY